MNKKLNVNSIYIIILMLDNFRRIIFNRVQWNGGDFVARGDQPVNSF